MDISQSLKDEGWYLTDDAIQSLNENGSITSIRTLQLKALDLDLREIGAPAFPEDILKRKNESIPGNIVIQIQKLRNISAPKANEESRAAPRMLKIALTDGHTVCQAVEVEQLPLLSLNTPPGTKLLLKGETVPMSHGIILLQPPYVEVLGGRVQSLIEKWELNRSLAKHTRGRVGEEGGPPPWISFGQKIVRPNLPDRNFKSLEDSKENKENAEFEAQRKDAIAEAARGGAKKVFGGGNARTLVDKNVKQIVDQGFSLEQAEQALHHTRNNVGRALRLLQKKEIGGGGGGGAGGGGERMGGNGGSRGGRRRGGGDREDDGGGSGGGPKPSGKVSLFDFLDGKLPSQNEKETEALNNTHSTSYNHNQYSNSNSSNQKSFSYNTSQSHKGSRHDGGGNRSRGGHNSGSDSRQNRDERNQNQKPPRFQNQQRYQDTNSHNPNWSYNSNDFGYDVSVNVSVRGGFGNTRVSRGGYDGYSDNSNYSNNNNRQRHQSGANPSMSYGSNDSSRNNRRFDGTSGSGSHFRSGGGSENYSRQLMEAGMPDIPEFPFKDTSSIPSLLSAGYFPPSGFSNNTQSQNPTLPPPLTQFSNNSNKGNFPEPTTTWHWKVGDKCMAKYWEDNMYYNAEVTGLSEKTCVVRFLEYGNFEEVFRDDCIPVAEEGRTHSPIEHSVMNMVHHNPPTNSNHFSGILEFRRGGTRPYVKSASDGPDRSHRRSQPRNAQPVYVPPAQRKETHPPLHKQ